VFIEPLPSSRQFLLSPLAATSHYAVSDSNLNLVMGKMVKYSENTVGKTVVEENVLNLF
jgi:hypothetical protein